MIAAAGEVVQQAVQGLRRSATADDLDGVRRDDGAAAGLEVAADAAPIVRAGRIAFPQAGIGVELVAGDRCGTRNVWRVVGGIRGADRQYLEDGVRKTDERFELVVTLRRGAAVELDRIDIADDEIHRSARGDRHPIQLDSDDRVPILRYQMLDVYLARRRRRGRSRTVSRGDVITARGVVRCGDLIDLDFKVGVRADAGADRRQGDRVERPGTQVDVRVRRVPNPVDGDVGGGDIAADACADRKILRPGGGAVAVEADDVPSYWRHRQRCMGEHRHK